MAQIQEKIGLQIELNGMTTVIKDAATFERLLREAKEDLLDIGINFGPATESYKKLSSEIDNAEKKFGALKYGNQQSRKELENSRRSVEMLNKAFMGATAAFTLFGEEGEKASQVQKIAMQGLTIVAAAQTVAQMELGGATVATTIAMKAETAAAATANVTLKALFTTIAANPVGALIAVLGLAVLAWNAFNDSTEQTISLQQELNKVTSDEADKLRTLGGILENVNSSNDARLATIDALKKQYPGFNAFIDEENRLNNDGRKFIELKTKALIEQAKVDFLIGKIKEVNNKMLENENSTIDSQLTLWDKFVAQLAKGWSAYGALGGEIVKVERATKNMKEKDKELQAEKDKLTKALQKELGELGKVNTELDGSEKKLKAQKEAEEKARKAKEDSLKVTKQQTENYKLLTKVLAENLDELSVIYNEWEKIKSLGKIDIGAPEIVKSIDKITKAREALVGKNLAQTLAELGMTVFQVGDAFIYVGDSIGLLEDNFGKFYEGVRAQLSDNVLQMTADQFGNFITTILDNANKMLGQGAITKESFKALKDITNQYIALNKVLKGTEGGPALFAGPNELDNAKKYMDIMNKLLIAEGEITVEKNKQNGDIKEIERFELKYSQILKERDLLLSRATENYRKQLMATADIPIANLDKIKEFANKLVQTGYLHKDQLQEFIDTAAEGGQKFTDLVDKIVKSRVDALNNVTTIIVQEENQIRDFLRQAQEGTLKGQRLYEESFKKALLNNLQLVYDFTQESNAIIINENQSRDKQLISLQEQFAKKGLDLTKFNLEERAAILDYYLQKQQKKELTAAQKFAEGLKKGIQELQNVLASAGQITSDYFALQLEKMTYDYEKNMGKIVGDTKLANDKRIELEKAYQTEKAAVEKRARLTALRIQMAETIAAGARAVVVALEAGPIAGPILAGINAGITATQIALIAQQISFVQSMRRGGRLASGGLVSGPSHEYGGVSFMNGGVQLEGNEAVINRGSTIKYSSLLDNINQSGGGRPIMVGNAMDSRLIEVLAKQKQEPIRAYVLEQDITKSQTINRRLEQLASF